jgi:hypothetical protein
MVFNVFYAIPLGGNACEPIRKGFIAKMAYLVEFWLILESNLVEHAPHKIFVELIQNYYTTYYRIYPN